MKPELNTFQMLNAAKTNLSNLNRSLSLVGAGLVISLAAGCASVDKKDNSAMSDSSAELSVAEVQPSQEELARNEKESAAKADEMMKSLKAPVVEPGAKTEQPVSKEVKPTVKEVVAEVTQKAVTAVADKGVKVAVEKEPAKAEVKKVAAKVEEAKKDVVKAPVVQKKGSVKPLAISEKDLPANYDIWVLKQGDTALTQGLVISTPTWEMGKEGYMSQIWLTFKENEIHINSSSDIASEAKNLGIRIDGGDLIPFTRIAENNIGIVEGEWLDKLANASKLDIYLGFFPGKKPTSDTFHSDTSLENLDRVVATYRKLSK